MFRIFAELYAHTKWGGGISQQHEGDFLVSGTIPLVSRDRGACQACAGGIPADYR